MKTSALLLFFLTLLGAVSAAGPVEDLREENLLLEAEIKMARTQEVYFVFDFRDNSVYLKSRGLQLKKLGIKDASFWGGQAGPEPRELLKKTSLFKPRREKLKPGEAASEGFELNALELADMPSSYRMLFKGGIELTVISSGEGVLWRLSSAARRICWLIKRPPLSVWNALRGRPFSSVLITMSGNDARSLYWAFPEGFGAVFYRPPGRN